MPRQAGKTTRIINQMKKNETHLMIVPSIHQKQYLIKQNPELKGRIMVLTEYKNTSWCDKNVDEVHIDDIDLCMGIIHKWGIVSLTNFPKSKKQVNF